MDKFLDKNNVSGLADLDNRFWHIWDKYFSQVCLIQHAYGGIVREWINWLDLNPTIQEEKLFNYLTNGGDIDMGKFTDTIYEDKPVNNKFKPVKNKFEPVKALDPCSITNWTLDPCSITNWKVIYTKKVRTYHSMKIILNKLIKELHPQNEYEEDTLERAARKYAENLPITRNNIVIPPFNIFNGKGKNARIKMDYTEFPNMEFVSPDIDINSLRIKKDTRGWSIQTYPNAKIELDDSNIESGDSNHRFKNIENVIRNISNRQFRVSNIEPMPYCEPNPDLLLARILKLIERGYVPIFDIPNLSKINEYIHSGLDCLHSGLDCMESYNKIYLLYNWIKKFGFNKIKYLYENNILITKKTYELIIHSYISIKDYKNAKKWIDHLHHLNIGNEWVSNASIIPLIKTGKVLLLKHFLKQFDHKPDLIPNPKISDSLLQYAIESTNVEMMQFVMHITGETLDYYSLLLILNNDCNIETLNYVLKHINLTVMTDVYKEQCMRVAFSNGRFEVLERLRNLNFTIGSIYLYGPELPNIFKPDPPKSGKNRAYIALDWLEQLNENNLIPCDKYIRLLSYYANKIIYKYGISHLSIDDRISYLRKLVDNTYDLDIDITNVLHTYIYGTEDIEELVSVLLLNPHLNSKIQEAISNYTNIKIQSKLDNIRKGINALPGSRLYEEKKSAFEKYQIENP